MNPPDAERAEAVSPAGPATDAAAPAESGTGGGSDGGTGVDGGTEVDGGTGVGREPGGGVGAQGEGGAGREAGGTERAASRTAANMLRTLAVVLAVVAGLVLLVPRPNQVIQPQVDVPNAALGARSAGFPLTVPSGLPPGWQATSARLQRGTDGVITWHVGYVTPTGSFAAFEQAGSPTRAWENTQVTDGPERGTLQVAGASWVVRSRTDRGITSWVLRRPGLTTIVTGTADAAELARLASSLHLS